MIAETLRTWLLGVIAAGMIVGILYALLPRGRMKAVAHTVGGMALLLVIVRPLLGLDLTELALRYEDYRQQIQALTEEYRRSGDAEFAALIADKTAAYIASKGDDLGVTCTPQVETEERDGVPLAQCRDAGYSQERGAVRVAQHGTGHRRRAPVLA